MSGAKEILQRRIQRRADKLWQEAGSVEGKREEFLRLAEQQIKQEEQAYDETLDDSFPASDPPANSGFTS